MENSKPYPYNPEFDGVRAHDAPPSYDNPNQVQPMLMPQPQYQQQQPHPFQAYPPPSQPPTVVTSQPQSTVVIQTVPVPVTYFGTHPHAMQCPSCHARVTTSVTYAPSMKTHVIAGILCLVGCYCCCCIPYCVDSCQGATHNCPNCGTYLGTAP